MTTCPSSSRKSPPSCSEDPYKSWPASRLKLGQRVETSSSSSSERGSRISTSERSFTSCSSDIVILSAKQKTDYPLLGGSRLRYWLCPPSSAHNWGELLSLYRGNVCVLTRLNYERCYRRARMPGGIHLRLLGRYEHVAMWPTSQNSVNGKFSIAPRSRRPRRAGEEPRREGGPVKGKRGKEESRPNAVTLITLLQPRELCLCQVTIISYTRWPFLNRPSEPPPGEYMEPTWGRETLARKGANADERASPKDSEQKHPPVGTRALLQQRDVLGGHGLPRRGGYLLRAQGQGQRHSALHLRADRRSEESRGRRAIHRLASVAGV